MLADQFPNIHVTWAKLAIAAASIFMLLLTRHFNYNKKVDVPIVGPGVRYTKWVAAIRNVWSARDSIHEGYIKHGRFAFQIPMMTRMDVFICDRSLTREYYSLDDDHMSFQAVMSEEFQFRWTLPGQQHTVRRIPNSVIAKALSWQKTRASNREDPFFHNFSSEFIHGLQEELKYLQLHQTTNQSHLTSMKFNGTSATQGWTAVPCFPLALKIVARLTTKSIFGEPLCRDSKFLDLCCKFADAVPRDAMVLRCFPSFSRPLVARFLTASGDVIRLQNAIFDEISSRRKTRLTNPMNDLLDFTIKWVDEHRSAGWDDWHITDMMSNTIFAALHTSSQLVVHTIFELASRPEYVAPLREEIAQCFAIHGVGTKAAIDDMHKIDSFVKETQRCNPLDASALARLVLKPFTFSNGLSVPPGSFIYTPNSPLFQDERFYENPTRFDGLRFARMRDQPELRSQCPLTATSEHSMHFGIGRHACPGRYMVSDEVKLVMVHFLTSFDVTMKNHGPRPKNVAFGKFMLPDMSAKIWLKQAIIDPLVDVVLMSNADQDDSKADNGI